jgi:hypothetical protein
MGWMNEERNIVGKGYVHLASRNSKMTKARTRTE